MAQPPQIPPYDVVTLGTLFGTAPKPELLDLAVRWTKSDVAQDGVVPFNIASRVAGHTRAATQEDYRTSPNLAQFPSPGGTVQEAGGNGGAKGRPASLRRLD